MVSKDNALLNFFKIAQDWWEKWWEARLSKNR
jgi:hypothetical protein